MTSILYMGIARVPNKSILADCSVEESTQQEKGLYAQKLKKVLESGRVEQHDRLTITDQDVGNIHYNSDSALLFLVITSSAYPQRTAFKLLSEARAEFEKQFNTELGQSRPSGLGKAAKPVFKRLMDRYQDAAKADKLASVALQVEEVKGVMQNNIQAALKNTENLETLLDSSDAMRNEASAFNRSTNQVKSRMRWKNMKMNIVIVLIILALALVIGLPMILNRNKSNKTGATGTTP